MKNSLELAGKVYTNLEDLPQLKVGDKIRTLKQSYFIFSIDHENGVATFKVGPKSSLMITAPNILQHDEGELFSKFEARKKTQGIKLKVKTKIASLGVRGTYFYTSYGKTNDLWMCVNEGEVEVESVEKKEKKLVKAGEGIFIAPKKLGKPKFYSWTKNINWNLDANEKIDHDLNLDSMYTDLLDVDYN